MKSKFCKKGEHRWCANRNPEECHCSCDCHWTLDQWLSQAQFVLRDGHHDNLSRAVAEARNRLNAIRKGLTP
jgi:hypothetical protein